MLAGIAGLLQAYAAEIGTAFGLLVLTLLYRRHRDDIAFWLTDLRYRLPLIGISRLASDPSPSRQPGWYNAELTLCTDYHKHFNPMKQSLFDNHLEYLRKGYDRGRTPLPFGLSVLIAVLVIGESLGFAYMLAAIFAIDASENTRSLLMIVIALVVSIGFLIATHFSGHQLYRTGLLRACLKRIRGEGGLSRNIPLDTISLNQDQSMDDGETEAVQCIRRVKAGVDDSGSYFALGATIVAILLLVAFSTWMRLEHFESVISKNTTQVSADPFSNDSAALPDVVAAPQASADAKAAKDIGKSQAMEATAGFLLLGLIFLVTQVVSIGCGYKYGFGSREGKKAFGETEGHSNYESYWRRYQHRLHLAQARLQDLQQQLEAPRFQETKTTKTFADFALEKESSPIVSAFVRTKPAEAAAPPADEAVERAIRRLKGTRMPKEQGAVLASLSGPEKAALRARLRKMKGTSDEQFAAEIERVL